MGQAGQGASHGEFSFAGQRRAVPSLGKGNRLGHKARRFAALVVYVERTRFSQLSRRVHPRPRYGIVPGVEAARVEANVSLPR